MPSIKTRHQAESGLVSQGWAAILLCMVSDWCRAVV